ncbi:MAG TPA: VOC family protein [Gemmatimonadales bacterium]
MTPSTRDASRPRPTGVAGLHHVAVVSRDLARSADFYGRILGLSDIGLGPVPVAPMERPGRLEEARGRWYGDATGRPGSLVAVVERPDAPEGHPGIGGSHHFALAVADRDILLRWKRRFLDEGYPVNGILDRHYFRSIYIKDPDGQIVELATLGPGWTIDEDAARIGEEHRAPPPEMINTNRDRARIAAENWPEAVPEITPAMRIRGLHHVTAIGTSIEDTAAFIAGRLGMRRVKRTNNFDDVNSFHWYWGVGGGPPGTLVTYFDRKPERERPVAMGAGQIAHYAVAAGAEAVEPLGATLGGAGLPTSPIAEFGPDAARFRALATRDPDGHPVLVSSIEGSTSYDVSDRPKREEAVR